MAFRLRDLLHGGDFLLRMVQIHLAHKSAMVHDQIYHRHIPAGYDSGQSIHDSDARKAKVQVIDED